MRRTSKLLPFLGLLICQLAFAFPMGGGSGFKSSGDAKDIKVVTTNFNGNLSSTDREVQHALDTIDDLVLGTSPVWGGITGTLSNQTDLQSALNAKQSTLTNSAGLASALSDESGTGLVAFTTSPVFTTPNIGSATGSISGNAGTATALATPRAINGTNFDGSAAIVLYPRTATTASSATPTINTDNTDFFYITAQAAAITSFTTNLSGTIHEGQKLTIRILDNGTARAITWGASFVARGVALPTTTVLSKYLTVGFSGNAVTTTWDCVAVSQE